MDTDRCSPCAGQSLTVVLPPPLVPCLVLSSIRALVCFQKNTPKDGRGRWTTAEEKVIDPTLFRNGGHIYWEIEEKPYAPRVGLGPSAVIRLLYGVRNHLG